MFKIIRKNQTVMDKELQRVIIVAELAPSPYFSIINVHLVDTNVFAKFYEIPLLPFQDIEKPKRCGRTNGRTDGGTDGQRGNSISQHSLRGV